ncbi:type II secretion system F family protein [Candidatus Woesearchaeota archaeon]|nr:type II secretion system F family protein [Candidatus Woesearchaeota archaeon]
MDNIKAIIKRILELISEIESYEACKRSMVDSANKLLAELKSKKISQSDYEKSLEKVLKGKTVDEWVKYYNSYIFSLLKFIESLNYQLMFSVHAVTSFDAMSEKEKEAIHAKIKSLPREGSSVRIEEIDKKIESALKGEEKEEKEPFILHKRVKEIPRGDERFEKLMHTLENIDEELSKVSEVSEEEVKEVSEEIEKFEKPKPRVVTKKTKEAEEMEKKAREIVEKIREPLPAEKPEEGFEEVARKITEKIEAEPAEEEAPEKLEIEEAIPLAEIPEPVEKEETIFSGIKEEFEAEAKAQPPEEITKGLMEEKPKVAELSPEEKEKVVEKKGRWYIYLDPPAIQFAKYLIRVISGKPIPPVVIPEEAIRYQPFVGYQRIKEFFSKEVEKQRTFVAPETKLSHSLQMEALRKRLAPKPLIEEIPKKVVAEEVKEIKKIAKEKETLRVYKPSLIGTVANMAVRKISFRLIEAFPIFFKNLYDSLRLANIKLLSNTYVNIMMLSVVIIFLLSLIGFGIFFSIKDYPTAQVILRTIFMSILVGATSFMMFYYYPSGKIKTRIRNINHNLPFAINHLAAVSGAGVPPTKMFKLLAESEEYGEISEEISKVSDYVDVFGYDLVTAIKSVSMTTPSGFFKEFLEGIISTIESGADIKDYLNQKSSESMVNYEIERQKYLETISTYSDIYTGILIAAPLFFVVALSLVSVLGGQIAGLEISTVVMLGAFLVIPALNILFIMFLSVTQPAA